jgi:hypothetical protein
LYFYDDKTDNVLVELPKEGRVITTNVYELSKYLKVRHVKTPWVKGINDEYTRFDGDDIEQLVQIHKGVKLYELRIHISKMAMKRDYQRIREINKPNFKLTRKLVSNANDGSSYIVVTAILPIWDIWAKIRANRNYNLDGEKPNYKLKNLYMVIDDTWYRFPYGNVNQNDAVCMGSNAPYSFKNTNQLFINWITTEFNMDYVHNLKANKVRYSGINVKDSGYMYDITSTRRSGSHSAIPPLLDLTQISLMLSNYKSTKRLNLIDVLYYLANVIEYDNIDYSSLFFKLPKKPWETINE